MLLDLPLRQPKNFCVAEENFALLPNNLQRLKFKALTLNRLMTFVIVNRVLQGLGLSGRITCLEGLAERCRAPSFPKAENPVLRPSVSGSPATPSTNVSGEVLFSKCSFYNFKTTISKLAFELSKRAPEIGILIGCRPCANDMGARTWLHGEAVLLKRSGSSSMICFKPPGQVFVLLEWRTACDRDIVLVLKFSPRA